MNKINLEELMREMSKTPRQIVYSMYDDITQIIKNGHKQKDILNKLIEKGILPHNFTYANFQKALYSEKVRRMKQQEIGNSDKEIVTSRRSDMPQGEINRTEDTSIPAYNVCAEAPSTPLRNEAAFPSPPDISEEERLALRAKKGAEERERLEKVRAKMKERDSQDNQQSVIIDPFTKRFTVND